MSWVCWVRFFPLIRRCDGCSLIYTFRLLSPFSHSHAQCALPSRRPHAHTNSTIFFSCSTPSTKRTFVLVLVCECISAHFPCLVAVHISSPPPPSSLYSLPPVLSHASFTFLCGQMYLSAIVFIPFVSSSLLLHVQSSFIRRGNTWVAFLLLCLIKICSF